MNQQFGLESAEQFCLFSAGSTHAVADMWSLEPHPDDKDDGMAFLHGEGKTQFKIAFHIPFFAKILLTQVSHITMSRFKAWKNHKLHLSIRGDAK